MKHQHPGDERDHSGNNSGDNSGDNDDRDVRRLLNLAGRRPEPPADQRQRVYQAALQAFNELPDVEPLSEPPGPTRLSGRVSVFSDTRIWIAAAASVVLGLVVALATLRTPAADAVGELIFATGEHQPEYRQTAIALMPDTQLQTAGDGHLMFLLQGNTSVRLDHHTHLTLHSSTRMTLHQGRIYVDSPGQGEPLQVKTSVGDISDIGTQFSVAIVAETMTVSVREGMVEVKLANDSVLMDADAGVGDLVSVRGSKIIEQSQLASTDASWNWIRMAAREFVLDNSNLHDFLLWATRESGLELHFTNEAVRMAARHTRLHGDIAGLTPEEAITMVLATTDFVVRDSLEHELLVDFKR